MDTVDQCDMKMSIVNISNMKKNECKEKKPKNGYVTGTVTYK